MTALCNTSIQELNGRLRSGELTAVALAQNAIEKRLQLDPVLQAYHQTDDDALLQAARDVDANPAQYATSPLAGIPMSAKSVFAVAGYACYAGGPQPLPAALSVEGSVIKHLRKQGALVTGVTHAAEFSVGGLGVNPHWGTPRNPWDATQHRVTGGSSAGAGVSVLEGSCTFALGTDTGGSVRVPASIAGLVGFKVSDSRWPVDGVVPLASRFDTIGVVGSHVDDVRRVANCIDELCDDLQDFTDYKGLTLADFNFQRASSHCWHELDDGIESVIETALSSLTIAGLQLHEHDNDLFAEAASLRDNGLNTAAVEVSQLLARECPDLIPQLSLHVREFIRTAETISESDYLKRLEQFVSWRQEVHQRMSPLDIVVLPTLRATAPTLATLEDRDQFVHYSDFLLHNTVLPSLNGSCAITLPVGLDAAGMPVGLQLVARKGSEYALLHAAELIEQQIGNTHERLGTAPLLQV